MTATLIDISVALRSGMPTWPGSPGVTLDRRLSIEDGDEATASVLTADVHCGTHVDAPSHFIASGATLDQVNLDVFVGPAVVAEVRPERRITAAVLEGIGVPRDVDRLLLKTLNSGGWAERDGFDEDFAALTADGAEWVLQRGIRLIGIDYLSVQRFEDDPTAHRILLGGGVIILEGLELAGVECGLYELLCLPLNLADAEAAPARAVLRRTIS